MVCGGGGGFGGGLGVETSDEMKTEQWEKEEGTHSMKNDQTTSNHNLNIDYYNYFCFYCAHKTTTITVACGCAPSLFTSRDSQRRCTIGMRYLRAKSNLGPVGVCRKFQQGRGERERRVSGAMEK